MFTNNNSPVKTYKNQTKSFYPLPEDSVIIETKKSDSSNKFSKYTDQKDLFKLLAKLSHHSIIYANGKIYHAVYGKSDRVKSHVITDYIKTIKYDGGAADPEE